MKILLLCVGKTSEKYLKEGEEIYLKRLSHYCKFEKKTIPDLKNRKNLPITEIKQNEGFIILKNLSPSDFIVLLDEKGDVLSSIEFSVFIEKKIIKSTRKIVFIIGGAYGFSENVYERANKKVRLSSMTFSHQMIRLFFLEQLYRSFSIIKKEKYHNT